MWYCVRNSLDVFSLSALFTSQTVWILISYVLLTNFHLIDSLFSVMCNILLQISDSPCKQKCLEILLFYFILLKDPPTPHTHLLLFVLEILNLGTELCPSHGCLIFLWVTDFQNPSCQTQWPIPVISVVYKQEAGGSPKLQGFPELLSVFQANQGYQVRHLSQKQNNLTGKSPSITGLFTKLPFPGEYSELKMTWEMLGIVRMFGRQIQGSNKAQWNVHVKEYYSFFWTHVLSYPF